VDALYSLCPCGGGSQSLFLLLCQSGPGPATVSVGPGRGQERCCGLRAPRECGLLQELCPG
jgi:hypothetical protein